MERTLPENAYITVLQRLEQINGEDLQIMVGNYHIGMNDEHKIYHIVTSSVEGKMFAGLDFTIPAFIDFLNKYMTVEQFDRVQTQLSFQIVRQGHMKQRNITAK